MKPSFRANVVSSFTIIKGAMIADTYTIFSTWDVTASKAENLRRLREENSIGASSTTWLRDVLKVVNRRFDPSGRDRPLIVTAKNGWDVEEWKPILLWHITRDEFLLRDFLQNWLFPTYEAGTFRIRPEDLRDYLRALGERGGTTEHAWAESTLKRVAAGLLKMATDFGLLRGAAYKEFASYHLPDRSFMYLLHAIREEQQNPRRILSSPDWRMFLMTPGDVEREVLRLHQYRKLDYQVAGSLVQLTLPYSSCREYAEEAVA
jgi:hypothetical protein